MPNVINTLYDSLLKNYWYPLAHISQLKKKPISRKILNQDIVIFLNSKNKPVAMADQCIHRGTKLSLGTVNEDCIRCPYHGWEFDSNGQCKLIPQTLTQSPRSKHKKSIRVFKSVIAYEHVWVSLSNSPLNKIPNFDKTLSQYKVIPEFYEFWQCDPFRICENELDLAHPTFVHPTTFGSPKGLEPTEVLLTENLAGLNLSAKLKIKHPKIQIKNTALNKNETFRQLNIDWIFPLTVRLSILYENGTNHVVCMNPVPISDNHCFITQFCLRNDNPSNEQIKSIVEFDRSVTLEDKKVLESIQSSFLDEFDDAFYLKTDMPGKIIRSKLLNALQQSN